MPSHLDTGGQRNSIILGAVIGGLVMFAAFQIYKPQEKRINKLETQVKAANRIGEQAMDQQQAASQERDLALQARDAAVASEKMARELKESTVIDYQRCVENKNTALQEKTEALQARDKAVRASAEATTKLQALEIVSAEQASDLRRKDVTIIERDVALRQLQASHTESEKQLRMSKQRIKQLQQRLVALEIPRDEQALMEKAEAAIQEKESAVAAKIEMAGKLEQAEIDKREALQETETLREQLATNQQELQTHKQNATNVNALKERADRAKSVHERLMKALWVGNIWKEFTRIEQDLLKERAKAAGYAWHGYKNGKHFHTYKTSKANNAFHATLRDVLALHGYNASWYRQTFEWMGYNVKNVKRGSDSLKNSVRTNFRVLVTTLVFNEKNKK